jgi:ubiquinone/menaquinone biosynthesis C-methylase UbiE
VLDIGCGTGSLALRLAEAGVAVTALDPASASLEVARHKPGAERVSWVHGDASALPDIQVDAVTMTGNVAQVFLSDEEWSTVLCGVRNVLAPGGHLVFEVRRPDRRAWEEWAAEPGPVLREVAGVGVVAQRLRVTKVALPYVSFEYSYTFPDGTVLTSASTLCFRTREDIETNLHSAGFVVLDVREAPDRLGREYVFIARPVDHLSR